jgi:transposase InsO family protein
MDEEQKKQVAIFRFGVIHDFVSGLRLERGERERLLRQKCSRRWQIPFSSNKTGLSRTTILRWVSMYQQTGGKLESLYPGNRSDQGKSRAMDEETACALIGLRREFARAPIGFLINQMEKRTLVSPGVVLSRSTVYRFLHQQGLMKSHETHPEDRRKFEAELPNDIWQSDSMHGPMIQQEAKNTKTYLFAFLDDQSRLVAHAEFYLREGLDSYLDAFRQALLKRGLPRKLYVDNAACFRSKHLEHITASLGIGLIHSTPYRPQGRGKIERWFRTVRDQFLQGFGGHTLEELNLGLECWIRDIYHGRPHSSTGQSPLRRFSDHSECIRLAPKELDDYFRKNARRRVAKDRTISLNGRLYEAPVSLIGKQVLLLYHEDYPERVEVVFNQKSYGPLVPVDLHVNCRIRRDRDRAIEIDPSERKQTYQGGRLWTNKREDKP